MYTKNKREARNNKIRFNWWVFNAIRDYKQNTITYNKLKAENIKIKKHLEAKEKLLQQNLLVINKLKKEVDFYVDCVNNIEWAIINNVAICPYCRRTQEIGHSPNCLNDKTKQKEEREHDQTTARRKRS